MNNSQAKPNNKVRSKRFDQTTLQYELENALAGQHLFTKIILILLLSLIFLATSIFIGILGVSIGIDLSLKTSSYLESTLTALVVAAWLVTAIFQNFNKSLLIVVIGLIVALVIQSLLIGLGLVESQSFLLARTALTILVVWVITGIVFFLIRFAIASIDILFKKSHYIKVTVIFVAFFGALVGVLTAISSEDQEPSFQIKVVAAFSGIGFEMALALGGWWANRRRGVPWVYPDSFRLWALMIGSWGGTSFQNLDLSTVNFRGAKLANTDLRARKLYRTCFQGVTGLERARVDSRYLDLENPKVQKLLTEGRSKDRDFSGLNLRGAYLQNAELRRFNFTDTDLTGADMQNADLRGSLLVRAQVIGVDFTNADLTGCCIEDWSINSQTCFTDVRCEYIYRKLDEHGEPIERFPANRNFELREFESLYQEVENVVELIFKEGENWQAALFSLRKLQLEDEELGLELKSIEKRGDLWVLKVTHNNAVPKQEVENRLNASFDEMKQKLAAKEQQIDKLLDIVADQAKTLKGYSKQPLGTSNNFFIVGSAITNLSGSGQIDYQEAANQVRNIVATSANSGKNSSFATNLLDKFQEQEVAVDTTQQTELIEQIILAEAQKDTVFKQFILLQGEQISEAMPESSISTAIRSAIAKLN